MKNTLVIWVTSDCNLTCKWCDQKYTMDKNKGYQMSLKEVHYIVNSCKSRGIHLDIIEITGGEATLWKHIKEGVRLFREICDEVTLVTNGNYPELVISLGLRTWVVSTSQATKEQMKQYEDHTELKPFILYNSHSHKKLTDVPIPESVPAQCNIRVTPSLAPQNLIAYIRGKVYYCCNTFQLSEKVPFNDETVCDFEDDFIQFYSNKKYDQPMCAYCHCNKLVWDKL